MDLQEFKKELNQKKIDLINQKNINQDELYEKSLKKFENTYSFIFMEELAELIQAISKKERQIEDAEYMLIEEIADTEIVIDLIKKRWNISNEDLRIAKEIKLQRLKNKDK